MYGYVAAQVIFREDGTFEFIGNNPMSENQLDFIVTGTWSRTGGQVTLKTGDDARAWHVTFEGGEAHFADPMNGDSFILFRPLPD